jgi:hypothetical protein
MVGFCEHGNEPVSSIKCGGFLDCLSDYQRLKKYCSPCRQLISKQREVKLKGRRIDTVRACATDLQFNFINTEPCLGFELVD